MLRIQREALAGYWRSRREVARFDIQFRLFEAFIFAPLTALVGHFLAGRSVVDSTDLIAFVLSPRGFLAIFLATAMFLTIRLLEQAGLSAIAIGAIFGQQVTSTAALRIVARLLPRLLPVAGCILLAGLGLAATLLIVAGLAARELLMRHDINYYLAEQPREFLDAAAVIAVVGVPTVIAAIWLAVRWRLVVPVVLCEQVGSAEALRSSARLVRGNWRRAAAAWLATALVVLSLGLLAAWLGRLCSVGATVLTGDGGRLQVSIFAVLLIVRTVLTGFVTMPGPCISAGAFAVLYCDFRRAREQHWTPTFCKSPATPASPRMRTAGGWLLALLPLIMAGTALVSTVTAVQQLYSDHPVAVTAHRGATGRSIENTLAAVQEAIDVGAQFAEIDVQMSKDHVLVVTHDSDFSRQAGVASKVWELTYDEIRRIPLSHAKAPELAPDYAPTFDELLDTAHGRIHLNVELKYYGNHQPRLAERVVAAVRAKGMSGQVIIQSLHYAGLEEVRRMAPDIPIGYLFSINAREPKRLDVDFLSVQMGRANGPFINAAHRRNQQVHVWTVDKPADMERLFDLGADNLITNRPHDALDLVHENNRLSPSERALRRVRTWLTD